MADLAGCLPRYLTVPTTALSFIPNEPWYLLRERPAVWFVEQRDREIDEGAGRPAKALVSDVAESCRRLEDVWRECKRAGWPDPRDPGSGKRPTNESPLYRRREVEIHHADLGLGYTPADWPQDYAEWELHHSLGQLPGRIPDSRDQLRFLTWLLGRSDFPADLKLTAW